MIKFGSVCSGIEAASVAWTALGWSAAWLSEIEPFPCAVLAHHYPDVPNHGDMTKLAARIIDGEIEAPDVLCGGTPCQAFSVAGNRQSLDDERGNLTLTFCEVADAIDARRIAAGQRESIILWENVPGVLNTKDNAFGCFLGKLAGEDSELQPAGGRWSNAGCVFGHKRAVAWRVLDAQFFGVAQRRRRVFVVASARNGFDPATVLFEFDGLRRNTPPSRKAGEGTSVSAAFSAGNSSNARSIGYIEEGTPPLRSGASGTNQVPTCVTFALQGSMIGRADTAGPQGSGIGEDIGFTLTKADQHAVAQGTTVRRLTPTECERLQGFPDGYTAIPWRGKSTPDGARYKALGNSWAVPVVRWIGQRIALAVSIANDNEVAQRGKAAA